MYIYSVPFVSRFRLCHCLLIHSGGDVTKELYELPDHIKSITGITKQKNENMLSNQMLSGIPEIDLGIELVSYFVKC